MSVSARQPSGALDVESIWREFHDALYGFIRRRVGSRETAEDLFQEVMLRIHREVTALNEPDIGDRLDPHHTVDQFFGQGVVLFLKNLELQHPGDGCQVVFYPVVNFCKKHIFFLQRTADLLFRFLQA
jgi:hypothetical protein